LWFDGQASEAAAFYTELFPNSRITNTSYYGESAPGEPAKVLTVEFELDGRTFTGLNGGPHFTFNEAVSFQISCADQEEVDRYWDAFTSDGGEESQCGWVKDRFGLSWQVIPTALPELLTDPDPERAQRALQAMLGMKKLDVAALRAAADGATADLAG
jgi:predicted 3-demethylubiquinone-9 3-methyltransferase (glyoxalase superfamily)